MDTKKASGKILILEDDLTLAYFMRKKLEAYGFTVMVVDEGRIGLLHSLSSEYFLLIIDIGLPNINGFKIISSVRTRGIKTPIIVITNEDIAEREKLSYEKLANIFHAKPINFPLLEAQVLSLAKLAETEERIALGDLVLEPAKHHLQKAGEEINLTGKEYELLLLLIKSKGNVLSRDEILNRTFNGRRESELGSIDTLVSRLRKKLGTYNEAPSIETIHGKGFRLNLSYFNN
jgi:DNA-binding response OmpR family regulator